MRARLTDSNGIELVLESRGLGGSLELRSPTGDRMVFRLNALDIRGLENNLAAMGWGTGADTE